MCVLYPLTSLFGTIPLSSTVFQYNDAQARVANLPYYVGLTEANSGVPFSEWEEKCSRLNEIRRELAPLVEAYNGYWRKTLIVLDHDLQVDPDPTTGRIGDIC